MNFGYWILEGSARQSRNKNDNAKTEAPSSLCELCRAGCRPAIGKMIKLIKQNREKYFIAAIICIIVIIITIPYIYGYLTCPDNKIFTGLIGPNGHDQAFYLGWGAKQAENGHILFEDKFNGYTERRLVFNPLWLLMGWSAKIFNISILKIFHIERIICSIVLLLIIYKIISSFISDVKWRLIAFSFTAMSSGFGFLFALLHKWIPDKFPASPLVYAPDLWIIESNIFLTMLWEVVLPAGTALFLLSIYLGYNTFFREKNWAWLTGLTTLALGTIYPYAVISVYFILGGCLVFKLISDKKYIRDIIIYTKIGIISVPIVLYDGYLVLTRPVLTTGQALYSSPNLLAYFLSFGVISIFAITGIFHILRKRKSDYYFLIIWITITFIQIYIPLKLIPFQMQLIMGIQIPLVIVAVLAMKNISILSKEYFKSPSFKFAEPAIISLLFCLALATSVYHYANLFVTMDKYSLPEYMAKSTEEAILWLAEKTEDSDVVLSHPKVAPYIPVLANNRMYCSDYPAPTADFVRKNEKINWLFNPDIHKSDKEIIHFLKANRIDYLFFDDRFQRTDEERMKKRLLSVNGLKLKFSNGNVIVLKVN